MSSGRWKDRGRGGIPIEQRAHRPKRRVELTDAVLVERPSFSIARAKLYRIITGARELLAELEGNAELRQLVGEWPQQVAEAADRIRERVRSAEDAWIESSGLGPRSTLPEAV